MSSDPEALSGLEDSPELFERMNALDTARDAFFAACDDHTLGSEETAHNLKATRHDLQDAFRSCIGSIPDEALAEMASGLVISYEGQSYTKLALIQTGRRPDVYDDDDIRQAITHSHAHNTKEEFIDQLVHSFGQTLKVVTKGVEKQAAKAQRAAAAGKMSIWIASQPLPQLDSDDTGNRTYIFRIEPALTAIHRTDFIPGANLNYDTDTATHGDITVPAVVTALMSKEEAIDAAFENIYGRLHSHLSALGRTGLEVFWVDPEV